MKESILCGVAYVNSTRGNKDFMKFKGKETTLIYKVFYQIQITSIRHKETKAS